MNSWLITLKESCGWYPGVRYPYSMHVRFHSVFVMHHSVATSTPYSYHKNYDKRKNLVMSLLKQSNDNQGIDESLSQVINKYPLFCKEFSQILWTVFLFLDLSNKKATRLLFVCSTAFISKCSRYRELMETRSIVLKKSSHWAKLGYLISVKKLSPA